MQHHRHFAFAGVPTLDVEPPDALEILHDIAGELAWLSERLMARNPPTTVGIADQLVRLERRLTAAITELELAQ